MSLYRKGVISVGASLYHTVGDRERALKQLNTDFNAIHNEVMLQSGYRADPYHDASGALWDWWKTIGVPIMNEWQKFYTEQMASVVTRFATNWEVFENWQERLKRLRDVVVNHGTVLTSPSPTDLPTTVWKDAADAARGVGKGAFSLLKIAAIGALGIGGIYVAGNLLKDKK